MPLTATWLGPADVERIADIRLRCHGASPSERSAFLRRTANARIADDDVLVLSDDTGDVATATSMSLRLNVRGTVLRCQGVAFVGTVRSHRRRRVEGQGLASRVMTAMQAKARERGQGVSMLAPFRVSFYERFGYGVVERQNVWTVPLAAMPDGDTAGFAEYGPPDFEDALANRGRQFDATHGDIATDARGLDHWITALAADGYRLIDRRDGRITSQFTIATETSGDSATAVLGKPFWDSPDAFGRMLALLGTLKDQYATARLHLPVDLPLQWWLRERQVTVRAADQFAPQCKWMTRMQAAIADVETFVAALRPAEHVTGTLRIGIGADHYRLDVNAGRVVAERCSGDVDLVTDAPTWAAIAFGDLPAEAACAAGRVRATNSFAFALLTSIASGPAPFCHEYF